ncbi:NAD-dependent epimerase/dehydratase family protein [Flavobacterium sp. MAH-1]|uniref:NAD-dependent epimerase/dehydratase family protein n=1 Tax=Flavobacterium agri TaxID=2743471 RepID=A0A7Y8Y3D5_9FLAO|nr:NAD-dependent epimerase/dehydratase family protein [Flavobacterium agri]NUY81733.1 NAD-dependent epimerase/dehydratase family protein [Flavobacterium agri]NYA71757.1 NAD-dependent epimerase/dehydratase family protein [Flavobacterium agri]
MRLKVIITGATGMVGEGVLLECLQNENVNEVLIVNRKPYDLEHPKLKQLLVPDFSKLQDRKAELEGFDTCFFCAGVSSVGMNEEKYTQITYDMTLSFAKTLVRINPNMVFTYVSGSHTDSTENGRVMWARVKGKTENDLMRLGFKAVYNFRPGVMYPTQSQKNWKTLYKWIAKSIRLVAPKSVLNISEVGKAMINAVVLGHTKHVLEISDIRYLASGYSHQQPS